MRNECADTTDPLPATPVRLLRLWSVEADATYDVHCRRPWRRTVVIRTHGGEGRLWLATGGFLTLRTGSVLVVGQHRIRRYRCTGIRWDFWWFECAPGRLPLPRGRVLHLPLAADEPGLVAAIAQDLRGVPGIGPAVASAGLGWLLHRWTAAGQRQTASRPDLAVAAVVGRMHAAVDAGQPVAVADLAAEAGYGERRLRDLFHAATGRNPKRYLDDLRLARASALIDRGLKVAAVATALGFNTPFHLSKAFKRRYGRAPTHRDTGF
jgi:AraC-like DNA-binding protein